MSDDPEQVVRAILSVQQAMESWQAAAHEAVEAGRVEHQTTSTMVALSSQAAMEACLDAEDLAVELAQMGSALEGARHGLMAAAAAVQARTRRHAELVEHLRQTNEAWIGHVWRPRHDHQAAQGNRVQAAQVPGMA